MARYLKQERLPRGQWVILFCLLSLALAPSLTHIHIFWLQGFSIQPVGQRITQFPWQDCALFFPSAWWRDKDPISTFYTLQWEHSTWPPNSFIFHSCSTHLKKLSNEIDRQTERENHKKRHTEGTDTALDFIKAQSLSSQTAFWMSVGSLKTTVLHHTPLNTHCVQSCCLIWSSLKCRNSLNTHMQRIQNLPQLRTFTSHNFTDQ